MKRVAQLRRLFEEHDEPYYGAFAQEVAGDDAWLELAAHAPVGSYMPWFFIACVRWLALRHPEAKVSATLLAGRLKPAALRAVKKFCFAHQAELEKLLKTGTTQTNDPLRCAVLFPAFCLAAARSPGRPLGLVEVGPSAGLNLCWDRYRYNYGPLGVFGDVDSRVRMGFEWRGPPPSHALAPVPLVGSRVGIDLTPLDVREPADVLKLRSFLVDHQLLDPAMEIARETPRKMIRGDAIALLEDEVMALPRDEVACVFHSYCTYQLGDAELRRFERVMARLLKRRALHWIRLEGQSLSIVSLGGEPELLARPDLAGAVHRFFEWVYSAAPPTRTGRPAALP